MSCLVQKSGKNTSLNRVAKVSKSETGERSDRQLEGSRDRGRTVPIQSHPCKALAHDGIDGESLETTCEGHMSVQGYGGTGELRPSMERRRTITRIACGTSRYTVKSMPFIVNISCEQRLVSDRRYTLTDLTKDVMTRV